MDLVEDIRFHQQEYSPEYRCLVNDSNENINAKKYPQVPSSFRKPGLDHKLWKVRFISNSRNQIFGLQLNIRVGLVFPAQKRINRFLKGTVTMLKASHVSPKRLMALIGSMTSV